MLGLTVSAQQPPTAQQRDLSETPNRPADANADVTTRVPAVPVVPRSYALVIGVAHYSKLSAKAQLQYADRDAESIYTTLISAEGGQFPPENVHRLVNETATLANMRHELEEWLPSVTKPDDRVLIYFAGHGFICPAACGNNLGKAFLGPYDLDPHNIAGSGYSMDDLGKTIGSRINGKWKVLLTDACHSGAIMPEADAAQVNRSLLDLNRSLFSLTASRDREQSFEGPAWDGGHGVFTYFVVRGLEGEADTSGDGMVTADELAEYVHTNVREATKGRQNPTSERGSFDPNMVLAYDPSRRKAAAAPQTKFGTLVVETNMDGTELWVDGKDEGILDKDKPRRLEGLAPGPHTIKGVRAGYEPDGPREEQVYPGQDTTVTIRILIPRKHNRAAEEPFDRGLEYYNKGYEANYRKAVTEFQQALQLDPQDSRAELYLGRAYTGLYDTENAAAAMKKAIEIDPDFYEARTSYAAVLLDRGDFDEAVRQLDVVTRREPENGTAWYLLSQAYVRKNSYDLAIEAGRKAVQFTPGNAEAHLWLADALRFKSQCPEAEPEYNRYLALSNFDSGALGKVNYYLVGSLIGAGVKKRAAQTDIWKDLRVQAKVGLCDCEWMQKRLDTARQYCQEALSLDQADMFANYRLGLVDAELYNSHGSVSLLAAARKHFGSVVATDPDSVEAGRARQYLANIDAVLAQLK
ncbi:MAG: tetratricopeptide repeat protein [Terriglobales bacterium]